MTIEKVPDMLGMIEFKDTEAHLHTWYKGIDDDMNEAVRMAIETLEAEPSTDCISRQAAKRALEDRFMELQKRHDDKRYETNYCLNTILELPPVNPQKTGHWIKYGKLYQCSECKELSCCQGNFCPDCGAKMNETQEESEVSDADSD